jgi:chemotaxis protein methyltransferase CheR
LNWKVGIVTQMDRGMGRGSAEGRPPVDAGSLAGEAREFVFTRADFDRIARLIHGHAGIALSPIKFDMVYSRLARRLRTTGDATFADYIRRLERNDPAEWESFVNALTTHLTSFFREAHHFELLQDHLIRLGKPKARIWCCAASTGEEPYSLAMACCELYGSMTPPVEIIASDIDTQVLAHGRAGVYAQDRTDKLAPDLMRRYFQCDAGHAHVRPELKRLIRFVRINLLEPAWPILGPLEAIFCRNVMIYFDKPTQHAILKRFVPLLRPEGRVFAGHSENFAHAGDLFRNLGRTVYGRLDGDRS